MTYCAWNSDTFFLFFLKMSTNVKRPVAVRTKLPSVLTPLVPSHVLVQKATIQTMREAVRVRVKLLAFTSLCLC